MTGRDTRAGDPNLHTHVFIANKVQGPDGALRGLTRLAIEQNGWASANNY